MQDFAQTVLAWTSQPGFIVAFIGCGVTVGLLLTAGRGTPAPAGKKRRKP